VFAEGEESAWRAGLAMRASARASASNDQPKPDDWENFDLVTQDWKGNLDIIATDMRANGVGVQADIDGPEMADDAAMIHDWQGAAQNLAASPPDDSVTKAEVLLIAGYGAINRGDYASAVAPLESFYRQWLADPNIQLSFYDQPCFLGFAYAMTGRTSEAETIFKRVRNYQRCYGMRADGFDHAGDWHSAVIAYTTAMALTPDLPFVFDHWGLALERHGDLKGALAAFREAAERGPHWAEPFKHWGDMLMREHQPAAAQVQYDEALRYAPHWQALIKAHAEAAAIRTQ
jgi:tetratricopeptide (TPR) repeat protein